MANYYNAQIGVVDASGTVNVIYPITKAANVDYSATINGTAVTTVNAALEKLKTIKAFAYNDLVNLAANTAPTSTSTTAAPTANALTNAYNYLNSNKSPNSHASTATTYGAGTETNYGHVKLSDEYLNPSNKNKAAYSIGASSYAVRKVYSLLDSKIQYHKNYSFDSVTIGANTATEITISASFVTQWTGAYCSFYNGSTLQPYIIFIQQTYSSDTTTKIFVFNAFPFNVTINKVQLNYTTA